MKDTIHNTISALIRDVAGSKASGFYRDIWGAARNFDELPSVAREDFLNVPLSKRRYKAEKALVKIVHSEQGMFLSEWSFDDIGREPWGITSRRPMVYLADPHEAIEKSMWCYENNMVPLIGERDPDVAMFAAGKYNIDSLITDRESLDTLLPYLSKRGEKLDCISILGDSFDISSLTRYTVFSGAVRLVMCLPETGVIAVASLNDMREFTAVENSFLENRDGFLTVTKLNPLVT